MERAADQELAVRLSHDREYVAVGVRVKRGVERVIGAETRNVSAAASRHRRKRSADHETSIDLRQGRVDRAIGIRLEGGTDGAVGREKNEIVRVDQSVDGAERAATTSEPDG